MLSIMGAMRKAATALYLPFEPVAEWEALSLILANISLGYKGRLSAAGVDEESSMGWSRRSGKSAS